MHEIYKRGVDRRPVPPSYATDLEKLPPEALGVFQIRIVDAMSGTNAKSIEMQIQKAGPESHLASVEALLASDDAGFLMQSCSVADRLTASQMARGLPGGIVVVFDGTVGVPAQRFVGVIKADTQAGFRRSRDEERAQIITEFLNNVFLTPATRLYKIGIFVEEIPAATRPDGWRAFVFDSNITQGNREAAAQYFYEDFLGCSFPSNGPYETNRFFDATKEFIRRLDYGVERKRDLVDALHTFVKTDQKPTFTPAEFAQTYLPVEDQDSFISHMVAKHVPVRAIVRDVSHMGSKLRRRRYKFGADADFSASQAALDAKRVLIDTKPAHELGGDGDEIWTSIIIKTDAVDEP